MVRFSRVWRTLLRMGHPQVRWLVWLMTQDGLMPSQFQGDEGGAGALPRNRVECGIIRKLLVHDPLWVYRTSPRLLVYPARRRGVDRRRCCLLRGRGWAVRSATHQRLEIQRTDRVD